MPITQAQVRLMSSGTGLQREQPVRRCGWATAGAAERMACGGKKPVAKGSLYPVLKTAGRGLAVRYAWADNPAGANLYNKEGLPASTFRTDDF